MGDTDEWYVVKQESGDCVIVSTIQLATSEGQVINLSAERWGPYPAKSEAIARRVGLIRAGKCKPV